jgi:molybdate transport system substrate-binding protein
VTSLPNWLLFVFLLVTSGAQADEILVSAAASLTDALEEIGRTYQSKGRHKILLTLGPSSFLARQIDEGAPVDIFFSADLAQMDLLEKNGRLEPGARPLPFEFANGELISAGILAFLIIMTIRPNEPRVRLVNHI